MSWDDIFKSLATELGREPDSDEVQQRILEMVSEPVICDKAASLGARPVITAASPS